MEFKILQKDLLKALSIVERGIATKAIIETLRGIKLEAKNGKLILTASKTELAIEYTIENVEIESEGVVLVLGTQFINIVRKLTDENHSLNIRSESNLLILETVNSKVSLISLDYYNYPDVYFDIDAQNYQIDKAILQKAYNKSKYAVDSNSTRPILGAINLKFQSDNLLVTSTDSKRLSFVTFDPVPGIDLELNISKNLFQDINRILDLIDEKELTMFCTKSLIQLECKNLRLKGRIVDGEYPEVSKIIPSRSNYSFEIDCNALASSLGKVLSLSDKMNSVVTIEQINDRLLVKFFIKELGGIEEFVDIDNISGSPFKIAFDPSYVLDALHSLALGKVQVRLEAETSAFAIVGTDDDNNIQVISPVRMS